MSIPKGAAVQQRFQGLSEEILQMFFFFFFLLHLALLWSLRLVCSTIFFSSRNVFEASASFKTSHSLRCSANVHV